MLLEGHTIEVRKSHRILFLNWCAIRWPTMTTIFTEDRIHTKSHDLFPLSEQGSSPEDFDKQLQPTSGEE